MGEKFNITQVKKRLNPPAIVKIYCIYLLFITLTFLLALLTTYLIYG